MAYFDSEDKKYRFHRANAMLNELQSLIKTLKSSSIIAGGGSLYLDKALKKLKSAENDFEKYVRFIQKK